MAGTRLVLTFLHKALALKAFPDILGASRNPLSIYFYLLSPVRILNTDSLPFHYTSFQDSSVTVLYSDGGTPLSRTF